MAFCIPLYLYDENIHDLVSGPNSDCSGCSIVSPTPEGTNVRLDVSQQTGGNAGMSMVFSQVLTAGVTTIGEVYVDPSSTAIQIWEINTTSSFSGDVLIIFTLPSFLSEAQFANIRVFHKGVDVTVTSGPNAPDYPSRTICGVIQGFSKVEIVWSFSCSSYPGTTYCKPYSNYWSAYCMSCDPFPFRVDKECNCLPMGACCTGGKDCSEDLTKEECAAMNGTWNEGKKCADANCCKWSCKPDQRINTADCRSCICNDPDKEICQATGECVDKCKESENKVLNQQTCKCDCKNPCPAGKKFPNDSTCNLAECICDPAICASQNLVLKSEPNPTCECICDPNVSEECTRLAGTNLAVTGCYAKCRDDQRRRTDIDCECECNPDYPGGGHIECKGKCYPGCYGSNQFFDMSSCECKCKDPCSPGKKFRSPGAPWGSDNCFCDCDPASATYDDCRCQEKIDINGAFFGPCPEGQKYDGYPSCKCVCENNDLVKCGSECKPKCPDSNMIYNSDCTKCVCDSLSGKIIECNNQCWDPCPSPDQIRNPDKGCICDTDCPSVVFGGLEYSQGTISSSECTYHVYCWRCGADGNPSRQSADLTYNQILDKPNCPAWGTEASPKYNSENEAKVGCCPDGQKWCPESGVCVPCVVLGGRDLFPNQSGDNCDCRCPNGQEWCDAQERCATKCTGGREFNNNCDCVCPSQGTFEFMWCEAQQTCVTKCYGGSQLNDNCDCVCPEGQEWCITQEKCATKCPGEKIFDNNCDCACPEDYPFWCNKDLLCYSCSGGGVQTQDGCDCVCPDGQEWCEAQQKCVTKCAGGRTLNNDCQCSCKSFESPCGNTCCPLGWQCVNGNCVYVFAV